MLTGVTVDPKQYEARIPVFPGSRMCRVFGYRGRGLPAWKPATGDGRVARLRELAPGIVPACVFQDWTDDTTTQAMVTAWLDEVDADARLTWKHEADRKREDPTVYRRRCYLLAQWVCEHPHGHYVTVIPTQTYQWTMGGAGKGNGDWSTYYTGIGTAGIDVYANSWENSYPDPGAFLAPLWRYRDTIGQPLEFPEFGAARVAGDADGRRRADWLYECGTMMRAQGVTAVAYWDDLGSNGTDLRLWTDRPATPEVLAWRAVMGAAV
jgi:hypothetical protein